MELYLPPENDHINPVNGQFRKGHKPWNKGISSKTYLTEKQINAAIENLRKYQTKGGCAGWNAKKVIAIKDNKLIGIYKSSEEAGRKLKTHGRNIRKVCSQERKTAAGYQFFWEEDDHLYAHLLLN